jgi:acyl-CoA thioester hydrolase
VQRRIERFRVRWIDTDASSRIHFTAVFRWVEVTEIELFRDLGLMDDRDRYPRRHVEAEFLVPMRFDDEIELELSPGRIGRTSLELVWEARHAGEVAARGSQTIVHVDADGKPAPLPEPLRTRLAV